MKYYFVDSVPKSILGSDAPIPTAKASKAKAGSTKNRKHKATKSDKELVPVVKLRTIRHAPISKERKFPAVPPRSKVRGRRNVKQAMSTPNKAALAHVRTPSVARAKATKAVMDGLPEGTPKGSKKTPTHRRNTRRQSARSSMSSASTLSSPVNTSSGGQGNQHTTEDSSEQVVTQEVADTPQLDTPQELPRGNLCPTAKLREIAWRTPFIIILDLICESTTDFQSLYNEYFPVVNPRQFNSRSRRYGAIELAVGGIAYEIGEQLGLEINEARTSPPSNRFLVECRKKFERRYLDSLVLLKNVRRRIGSTPSIFWYHPTETIFSIFAQYCCGPGTNAATELTNTLLGPFINGNYRSSIPTAERFINSDNEYATAVAQTAIHEHACRVLLSASNNYESGPKPTLPNNMEPRAGETDIQYFCRTSTEMNHQQYTEAITNVGGYTVQFGPQHHGFSIHPMYDLYGWAIGAYGEFLDPSYVTAPLQAMAAMTMELDTALHIATSTDDHSDEENNQEIYGHGTGNEYIVKPWNVIQNHAAWLTQNHQVQDAITGGPNVPLSQDDCIEFWECFKFQAIVQNFEDLYIGNKSSARSILRDRLLRALTQPPEEES